MSKLKVLELFGGIGACSKALERLGIDYEIADYVEIDKYAVKSFNAMHNTNFEPQDICEWDKDIEVDLIMHGSPCQDFSLAGKQAGGDKDSGTRSSLMYETIRIVEKTRPKYVIWENVKNVISKKHIHNFNAYITRMRMLGYWSYYQVLNAKDYGMPQNRERVFVISIRSDANSYGCHISNYRFPPKQELKLKLKDMLEDKVDEKYYLSEKLLEYHLRKHNDGQHFGQFTPKEKDDCVIARTIHNSALNRTDDNFVIEDHIKIKNATKKGYLEAYEGDGVNISSRMKYQRGNVQKESIQTITTSGGNDRGVVDVVNQKLRIRKLTPREVWRLMGFDDTDFEKAEKVNSNTQLYKQAGNSIVVNVLEAILKELLLNE